MYTADRESVPAAANVVVVMATPFAFTAAGAPMAVPPIQNCTVPVGVTVPLAGATPAARVTGWPAVAGLGEADISVVVAVGPKLTPIVMHGEAPC